MRVKFVVLSALLAVIALGTSSTSDAITVQAHNLKDVDQAHIATALTTLGLDPIESSDFNPDDSGDVKIGLESGGVIDSSRANGTDRIAPSNELLWGWFGDLGLVTNPTEFPWRAIVRLSVTFPTSGNKMCSGVLIDPKYVLTAGQCVYNITNDEWASSIQVVPAYDLGNEPYGHANKTALHSWTGWTQSHDSNYDMGYMKLDRPVGALTGWLGYGYNSDDNFFGSNTFINAGYPKDSHHDGEQMYSRSGPLSQVDQYTLITNGGSTGTLYGSGLWTNDRVYGVFREGSPQDSGAYYTRMTEPKFNSIQTKISDNTPSQVDLIPLDVNTSSSSVMAGTTLAWMDFRLHNYSSVPWSAGTVSIKIYLSTNNTISTNDTLLKETSYMGSLNTKSTKKLGLTPPTIPIDKNGVYWIGVILDIADADTSNNSTSGWDAAQITITPPELTVNPSSLTFSATAGGANPPAQTVNTAVTGGGSFSWAATSTADWLVVSPPSGTNADSISVSTNIGGLSANTYQGEVVVSIPSNPNITPKTIAVTLNVAQGNPILEVSPTSLTLSAVEGGNNPTATLDIQNGGGGVLNWGVSTDADWLILSPYNGQAPATVNALAEIGELGPDTHTGYITVTGSNGQSQRVTTILTLGAKNGGVPILHASPPRLSFEAVVGGGQPAGQAFTIQNLGGGAIDWTASTNVAWLTVNNPAGTAPATLSAIVNTNGLQPGMHVGQITVSSAAAQGSPQLIYVILALRLPPTLAIDGNLLIFSALTGQGNPDDKAFVVRNSGDGDFDWTASENIAWLSLDKTSGPAPATVNVSGDVSNLGIGIHTGDIKVSSATATGSPKTVTAKMYLGKGPTLGTSPQAIYFDAIDGEGNPKPAVINVANEGRGELGWKASEDITWLTLNETNGTVPAFSQQQLSVSVNASGLAPRDTPYTGRITFRSENGQGSPQTIQAALMVASKARYCRIPAGGSDWIMKTNQAKLKLENVQTTIGGDGGCTIKGQLRVDLPQNVNLQADITASVDADNRLTLTSSPLTLHIANFSLELAQGFSVQEDVGLVASGGTWKIPAMLGGGDKVFNAEVRIGPNGLSIAGQQTFDLPALDWGNFSMTNNKGSVSFTTDGQYEIKVTGDINIAVSGSAGASATASLFLNEGGIRTGSISNFTVSGFAGLDLTALGATVESDRLSVSAAKLKTPEEWGGADVALYDLVIYKTGKVKIGGGEFRLPEIKAGDTKLSSLYGSIRSRDSGGYEITAAGAFGMPAMGSAGDCSVNVAVTLYTSSSGARVLEISPLDKRPTMMALSRVTPSYAPGANLSPTGLQLREVTLGMHCTPGVAIGTTSFYITGVEGSITLSSGIDKIKIKLWIEHATKVGTTALISADPQVTIWPKPFKMAFESNLYLVGKSISKATASISSKKFESTITLDYYVIHGDFTINAGPGYFNGSGQASVTVPKGVIINERWLKVPSSDYSLTQVNANFSNERIEIIQKIWKYGIRATYDFASGVLSFGRTLQVFQVNNAQIQQARQAMLRGEQVEGALDGRFAFDPNGDVRIKLPVNYPTPDPSLLRASDVVTPYQMTLQSDVIFAMVQPPDGDLAFSLIDPNGQEITSNTLPANVEFVQTVEVSQVQSMYSIAQAEIGTWQAKISGATDTTPYSLTHVANTPPPILSNPIITPTANPDQFEVSWTLNAVEPSATINIYANNGTFITGTQYIYAGLPVVKGLTSPTNGPGTHLLDVSELPSGNYTFWIEAISAGSEAMVRGYLEQAGSVISQVVDHTASFPTTWTPAISATTDVKQGEMLIEWDDNLHPDVDSYTVYITTTDVFSPAVEVTRTIEVDKIGYEATGGAILDNVEPGQTYHISIGAHGSEASQMMRSQIAGRQQTGKPNVMVNSGAGLTVWSQAQTVTTSQPDFILSTAATDPKVGIGSPPTALELFLELASNLPYPVELDLDYERLPDGIYVRFEPDLVTATAQVRAYISATATLTEGYYAVPILASSGRLEHDLTLSVEVKAGWQGESWQIYLPIILKDN